MTQKHQIQLFEEKKIWTIWDYQEEKKKEGNETVTNCHSLKMRADDGRMRLSDVADTEQFLRLIKSIPSPKATGCEYNSRQKRHESVIVGNKLYSR